jgi:protein involved in polysaccharide export with SLBB domain
MKALYRRGAVLASILWAASLAASAQVPPDVFGAAAMPAGQAVQAMPAAPALDLTRSLSLGADAADQPVPGMYPGMYPMYPVPPAEPQPPRVERPRVEPQPSNFQRFVQQATGRMLPVYGQQLFNMPAGYVPITQAPAPNDYLLGPGDEIRLQVWGSVDADKRLVIDRSGQIYLPKVGAINLTGVRAGDLEAVLRSKIGRIFKNFDLNATVGRLRSVQIYVVGHALQPGTYTVSSLSTLINALFEVGGPSGTGSMRNIQLKRDGRIVGTLDLYDFIAHGDRSGDAALRPGDVIVIPPVGPRVAVLGAFEQPAIYELKGAGSVGDVLALGGGLSVLAKSGKALLERIDPATETARRVEDFALDPAGLQHRLRDGDILTLFEISPQFANAVTLRGNVAEPLRYPYTPGMRVRDLVPSRDALITPDYYRRKNLLVLSDKTKAADVESGVRKLLDEVNWEYAVIERLDRDSLTTRLIPFNLGRAVNEADDQHNLELQPGDIVTILSKNDLRVPQDRQTRLVRVEGEVAAPGIYQVKVGETLPQLLARLGGVTGNAYLYGAEFTRESVRQQQQKNLDSVIRKLEAQLQAEIGKQLSDANAKMEAQDQLLAQQQQLERMKTFKSSGRVSLELPPNQMAVEALPSLPLEDGDAIHIPSRPGFVTAVGEVYNENAIIYRAGRTVGDVLESAGVSDNAELRYAFVLRADGSVKAARDVGGLFTLGGFESLELMPGDTVVVPAKLDRRTNWTKFVTGLKDWTQVLYQLGLGVAAWKVLE